MKTFTAILFTVVWVISLALGAPISTFNVLMVALFALTIPAGLDFIKSLFAPKSIDTWDHTKSGSQMRFYHDKRRTTPFITFTR